MTFWAKLFQVISCCRQHKNIFLATAAIIMCCTMGGLVYSAVARTPGAPATPPPPPPQHSQQLLAAHSNNVIRQTSLLLQFSSTRSLVIGGISLAALATAIGVVALVTILCSRHTSRDTPGTGGTPAACPAPTLLPQPVPLTTPHLPPGQVWMPSISALERSQ